MGHVGPHALPQTPVVPSRPCVGLLYLPPQVSAERYFLPQDTNGAMSSQLWEEALYQALSSVYKSFPLHGGGICSV